MRLELVAQGKNRNRSRHLRLHRNGDFQHELLALLNGTRLEDERLVPVRARGQVAEGRNRVALDLFIIRRPKQIHQRLQEPCLDDGRLVLGVDRNIADTSDGRENEWEVRGPKQTKERPETVGLDNFQLILFVGREIPKRQSRLALDLGRGGLGQVDQVLDKAGLGLGQPPPVGSVDSNIAQRGRAVVLHINIRG